MGRSGGVVVSTVVATSYRLRSFLENNNTQSLFLRVWSCCAIREMQ